MSLRAQGCCSSLCFIQHLLSCCPLITAMSPTLPECFQGPALTAELKHQLWRQCVSSSAGAFPAPPSQAPAHAPAHRLCRSRMGPHGRSDWHRQQRLTCELWARNVAPSKKRERVGGSQFCCSMAVSVEARRQ